jgi:hypothetical protein
MTPDLKTLRSVATKAARRNWTDDDMQAFDDAFRPQAVLSLLDRVEAAEATAETVRTLEAENAARKGREEGYQGIITALEAERDRLRGALAEARGTLAALSSGEFRDTAWRGVERIDAALNPTGVGEAG